MKRRLITGFATAALLSSAAVPVTNSLSSSLAPHYAATHVAEAALSASQNSFLQSAIPQAQAAAYKYGVYPSVMLAQAILESGWGQSQLAQAPNYNLFGIKGSYNGQSVNMNTGEYGSNGYYNTNAQFRKYPNYQASFEDNGAVIRNNPQYYINVWLENAASYRQATAGLKAYATAPNYTAQLNSIIAAYNLNQYDPQISYVNQAATAKRAVAVYNWPTDPSVAKQTGTLKAGQRVTVTEYITNYNGSKFAKTNYGWIDASALGSTSKPISGSGNTSSNKNTSSTTTTYKEVKAKGKVQINYKPGYDIAVWNQPGGHTTGAMLRHGTTWLYSAYAVVNGQKWYKVGTNQWIMAKYTAAPGTVKNINNITQPKSENDTSKVQMTKERSVAYINYKPGYGIAVWSQPGKGAIKGKYLPHGSSWKTYGYAYVNSHKWYNLGGNQWIDSEYVSTSRVTKTENAVKPKATSQVTKVTGTAKINYIDGYGVLVWSEPGSKATKKYLPSGSHWKFFGMTWIKGEAWYNLGGNQWVPAKYLLIQK
ncbi:MAG: glycoside hydrolase family 73 protein [Lactobacillus sp.]|jgi:flagellum-specific peptidoglycan hydrolase FlgJ|nr:glycoside hydrolase family 73 protein [Lactobacillus sp.]MCH4068627.1 glycoside hydrolase family 73 protein [Lactobacillus sp.]MCI1304522.1 glycoside hydrolase family 73 protein [Lactobacillus sp.]MCI1330618.1 glycoside hydrolase family 73 protein [Lactobacillus sp.]MCI1360042.1 glycoside hydrolase family 73 protein [Lactobacillus sp.]